MMRQGRWHDKVPRCAGLTLVELLITLAVTALMGAALASMLAAVSHGTDASIDLRDALVKGKTLNERITQAVRTSREVLDYGSDHIELRMSEDDGGYDVLRIEHDADEHTLVRRYRPAGSTTWDEQIWARHVIAWSVTGDQPDPQTVSLLSFRLTSQAGALEQTAIGAVSLRN